jgi:hypothetical protein
MSSQLVSGNAQHGQVLNFILVVSPPLRKELSEHENDWYVDFLPVANWPGQAIRKVHKQ